MCSVQGARCSVCLVWDCATCNMQCAMCNVQCEMCNAQCAMWNVQLHKYLPGFITQHGVDPRAQPMQISTYFVLEHSFLTHINPAMHHFHRFKIHSFTISIKAWLHLPLSLLFTFFPSLVPSLNSVLTSQPIRTCSLLLVSLDFSLHSLHRGEFL